MGDRKTEDSWRVRAIVGDWMEVQTRTCVMRKYEDALAGALRRESGRAQLTRAGDSDELKTSVSDPERRDPDAHAHEIPRQALIESA